MEQDYYDIIASQATLRKSQGNHPKSRYNRIIDQVPRRQQESDSDLGVFPHRRSHLTRITYSQAGDDGNYNTRTIDQPERRIAVADKLIQTSITLMQTIIHEKMTRNIMGVGSNERLVAKHPNDRRLKTIRSYDSVVTKEFVHGRRKGRQVEGKTSQRSRNHQTDNRFSQLRSDKDSSPFASKYPQKNNHSRQPFEKSLDSLNDEKKINNRAKQNFVSKHHRYHKQDNNLNNSKKLANKKVESSNETNTNMSQSAAESLEDNDLFHLIPSEEKQLELFRYGKFSNLLRQAKVVMRSRARRKLDKLRRKCRGKKDCKIDYEPDQKELDIDYVTKMKAMKDLTKNSKKKKKRKRKKRQKRKKRKLFAEGDDSEDAVTLDVDTETINELYQRHLEKNKRTNTESGEAIKQISQLMNSSEDSAEEEKKRPKRRKRVKKRKKRKLKIEESATTYDENG
ncbi:hypothetical protein HELRODRAFT_163178 [Helobdella robusta]|uniref:Uncharacterized protein n=1 Tax=Helobdella robusta TaxID=6412 RepID=T1ETR6_HELRO|nr:hypothetical protein HELRODRAFT_163178 [Helobdella robusta]ESN96146.1 hypothetical protein HELRODRAFT_163178 [Helobdella robusta]